MKIIGIGLNKTGTKTLGVFFKELGFKHQSFSVDYFQDFKSGKIDSLMKIVENYDSFEDWPWPLIYKEINQNFEDCKFILTTRKSPEVWFKSLCNMAVRIGPFNKIEKYVYGHSMPQGKKKEHISYYLNHNQHVRDYFKNQPDKLLELCWEDGDGYEKIAEFLNLTLKKLPELAQVNKSLPVYSGNNLLFARIYQFGFQLVFRKWLKEFRAKNNL